MRVLAGGPAREIESGLFRLHVEGLEAQGDVEVRHELVVPVEEGDPRWHAAKIERVALARQRMMAEAGHYDALFMVDTDVIVGPGVLERMAAIDADVVYGVYWTEAQWGQPGPIAPQVWTHHPYLTNDGTWAALNRPGAQAVEVLGGGACTLIRGRGFESRYHPLLTSLQRAETDFAGAGWQGSMWGGEDRTYCLGLETRGVRQVALTGLPIVHAYDEWMHDESYLPIIRRIVGL